VTTPARARRDRTRRDPTIAPTPAGSLTTTVVAAGAVACVAGLAIAVQTTTYDIWAAFWIAPALLLLTVPIARRAAARFGDPRLGKTILLAAAVKVIGGSVARYVMAYGVYDGAADANRYHVVGSQLAPALRSGDYSDLGAMSGTRFIEVLTGQVYALTGPTRLGGFMVFSWLAFLGLYFFYRAFRTAVPDGDHRRYALLVFFFPTLVFWPSSVGKEAWMVACLGLAALGCAQLLAGERRGLVWAALGLWGAAVVRPHVALILLIALAMAAPARLLGARVVAHLGASRRRHGAGAGVAVALLLLVAAGMLTNRAEEFFGLDTLDVESAQEVKADVQRRTAQGGSEFTATIADDPAAFAVATVTVLFRPFPFEAHNAQALLSAGEATLLALLVLVSLPRLVRLPIAAARAPYVLLALAFLGGFVYAFSVIANFGILARQRTQLLPFLFVLLALRTAPRHSQSPPRRAPPARNSSHQHARGARAGA
jgi:hypothetical protein